MITKVWKVQVTNPEPGQVALVESSDWLLIDKVLEQLINNGQRFVVTHKEIHHEVEPATSDGGITD